MDNQTCGVELGSCSYQSQIESCYIFDTGVYNHDNYGYCFPCTDGYPSDEIHMQWIVTSDAITVNPDISLPEFELKRIVYFSCAVAYSSTGIYEF